MHQPPQMTLTNSEAWALILSIIMPFMVSLLKRPEWPRWAKVSLAVGLSLVGGLGTAFFDNQLAFTWVKAVVDAAIIIAGSQAFYLKWFEGTVIGAAIEKRLREM